MTAVALEVRGLRVAFPDRDAPGGRREVVHGLDLDLVPGRVLALVGESGSGKSVSATAALGLLPPGTTVNGTIRLRDGGSTIELLGAGPGTLRSVRGARIGAVFQEPVSAWNPVQRIGVQIAEAVRAHEPGAADVDERVAASLTAAGLDDAVRVAASFPHELSGGQLQRAMIAMATVLAPAVLLADEPTTALDVTVQAGVLDLLRGLARDWRTAVLLITHDMGVVADLADDVVVLRAGEVVERGTVDEVLGSPSAPYTRELLAAVPSVTTAVASSTVSAPAGPPAAKVRDLRVVYPTARAGLGRRAEVVAVDGVDLDLAPGRTVGVVGESGSGKSTLAACLTGLRRPTSGRVEVDGTDLATRRGRRLREVQRRAGIVFQDPGSSLNPRRTVGWSVAEPLQLAGWPRATQSPRVRGLLESVGLDPSLVVRYPHQLSGGQRQRVAIARALALEPRLLVADEPTSALDVSVQARVLRLLADLQRELGFACLFISHDLAVVAAVAHEVVVMRAGKVVERGPAADVLRAPTADYTRTLLAAAPVADPRRQRQRRAALLG